MKKVVSLFFTLFFITVLILAYFNTNQLIIVYAAYSDNSIRSLAKCLNSRGFKMYGATECSACAIEKGYFGESFKYINYIDCDQERDLCQAKNIRAYPTWEDGSNRQYKGAMSLETLARVSGCQTVKEDSRKTRGYDPGQFAAAFIAGLLSFLAPCLLPLLPSYFSVITGFTFADLYGLDFEKIRSRVFISGLFFAGGFTLIFTMLGATGSIVGQLLDTYLPFLLKLNGIFLIGLGLLQLGIFKFEALQFDFAWKVQRRFTKLGFVTATVTGIAAALCWIPCIGPLLTPILILSAKSETVVYGSVLLFIYSLGLTLPFLLAGLFFPSVIRVLKDYRQLFHRISQVAGLFLIAFGSVLIFNKYRLFLDKFYLLVGFISNKL